MPRGTQCQLKAGQLFAVLSYTFSQEHPLGYEHSAPCFLLEMLESVDVFQKVKSALRT